MMSKIYQNAVLNVSADSGIDSRSGCFVDRSELSIVPLGFRSPQLSSSWKLLPDASILFHWMADAPSLSRAWIHRERQVARRILHFTKTELVWECCGFEGTSFASEMLPGGAPFQRLFNLDNKYQIGRLQQGLVQGAEETYAAWNDVCEKLSERDLTKPTDMAIVLSDLAKDFADILPEDQYIAGLWRSTLPQSLLWYVRTCKSDGHEYIAPSWSWLSKNGIVTLANRFDISKKKPLTAVLNISIKLKYDDPYGPVKSGTIELEGILRLVKFSFGHETNDFQVSVLDHKEHNEMRVIGSSWDSDQGNMYDLKLDAAALEGPDLKCFCFFVTIEQWGSQQDSRREIACLLLKRVGEEGNFTRIGTIVLKDLSALKMRYRIHRDVNWEIEPDHWKAFQGQIQRNQDEAIRAEMAQTEDNDDGEDEAFAEDSGVLVTQVMNCYDYSTVVLYTLYI